MLESAFNLLLDKFFLENAEEIDSSIYNLIAN
jgi:hypothetical protein